MSSTDERRHVARRLVARRLAERRLAERDIAIDLEPYDQESVSGQDLIDTYDERAAAQLSSHHRSVRRHPGLPGSGGAGRRRRAAGTVPGPHR